MGLMWCRYAMPFTSPEHGGSPNKIEPSKLNPCIWLHMLPVLPLECRTLLHYNFHSLTIHSSDK